MAATDKPYRNQQTLNVVFAVSCVAMLLTTLWMLVDDYNREFKTVQRKFRDVVKVTPHQVRIMRSQAGAKWKDILTGVLEEMGEAV